MYETAYQRLEESLTDLVAEEQAKLGYRKEEIRLYYPLSTLNHFFAAQFSAPFSVDFFSETYYHRSCRDCIWQTGRRNVLS